LVEAEARDVEVKSKNFIFELCRSHRNLLLVDGEAVLVHILSKRSSKRQITTEVELDEHFLWRMVVCCCSFVDKVLCMNVLGWLER
jgi:hypothetical protein